MSAHTPGPWHAGTGNGFGSVFAKSGRMKADEGGTSLTPIATIHDFAGERDANIALIAAAPILLAALKSAAASIEVTAATALHRAKAGDNTIANTGLHDELMRNVQLYRHVIAQAEGAAS